MFRRLGGQIRPPWKQVNHIAVNFDGAALVAFLFIQLTQSQVNLG